MTIRSSGHNTHTKTNKVWARDPRLRGHNQTHFGQGKRSRRLPSRLEGHAVDDCITAEYAMLAVSDLANITLAKLEKASAEETPHGEVEVREGVHYRRGTNRVYIPRCFRQQVMYLAYAYAGGHIGIGKTIKVLTRTVWWPELAEDVAAFIAGCLLCQCLRRKREKMGTGSLERDRFNELISIDYVGPRDHDGRICYALIIVDHCTRFAMGASTLDPTAQFAWNVLRLRWIPVFGAPSLILSAFSHSRRHFRTHCEDPTSNT